MDAERFDRITKSLHGATNRRRVLGGVTVGALAGLLGWHSADAAECAKEGQKPKEDKPCCVGTPVDGRCPGETAPVTGECISSGGFPTTCDCRNAAGAVCAPAGACVQFFGGICLQEFFPCACAPL